MKLLQYSNYHRSLRVAALFFAFVLTFESGLLSDSTRQLSMQTENYLANAIGMTASVPPNGLNEVTAELTRRQNELDAREAALQEREIAIGISTESAPQTDTSTYILASILFILLVLILLNYTLDYLRLKESRDLQPV